MCPFIFCFINLTLCYGYFPMPSIAKMTLSGCLLFYALDVP